MIGLDSLDAPTATGGAWPGGVERALDWFDRALARGSAYDDEDLQVFWDIRVTDTQTPSERP